MFDNNTPEHVLRFTVLRPPLSERNLPSLKLEETDLKTRVVRVRLRAERAALATRELEDRPAIRQPTSQNLRTVEVIEKALRTIGGRPSATVAEFRRAASEQGHADEPSRDLEALSDALLVRLLGGIAPSNTPATSIVDRNYKLGLLLRHELDADTRLERYLTRPIEVPELELPVEDPATEPTPPRPSDAETQNLVAELTSLPLTNVLRLPEQDDCRFHKPLSIKDSGVDLLSANAKTTLEALELDPRLLPVPDLLQQIEARSATAASRVGNPQMVALESTPTLGALRPVGVADLLVIKQHIKRYKTIEIAHVENVMAGETRNRTHRFFERSEEIFVRETETTREKKEELETAERFEVNREVSSTIKNDQQLGFDLSVSGKYGPTVEFSSDFSLKQSESQERTQRTASTFAREVIGRSIDRVVERVREERIRKLVRETEETNFHGFENKDSDHKVGIYQYLEKVYETQIFNYGKRMMFDFMVPEPASYLWYVKDIPKADAELPDPPIPLEEEAPDASHIDSSNYLRLASLYGATGIDAPPPVLTTVYASHKEGTGGGEGGKPRSIHKTDVDIPAGYLPWLSTATFQATTDDEISIFANLGNSTATIIRDRGTDGGGLRVMQRQMALFPSLASPSKGAYKLPFSIVVYEAANWSVSLQVLCLRTPELLLEWKRKTFETLQQAYLTLKQAYEQAVREIRARAAQEDQRTDRITFDDPPSANLKTVRRELKKHCISIATRQRYEAFAATFDGTDTTPPWFDFNRAALEGSYIRFLEQAFEWDQMQYVCYPYFWGRRSKWHRMFSYAESADHVFKEFLQAGSARVVVPVRPGFERALLYFLATGLIWSGSDAPPLIGSPLYVSIVEELQERTGAPKGEIPVGDPWEATVPTSLVLLRRQMSLPEWENKNADGWDWHPILGPNP